MSAPLADIRVVEVGNLVAGSYAARLLADAGAEQLAKADPRRPRQRGARQPHLREGPDPGPRRGESIQAEAGDGDRSGPLCGRDLSLMIYSRVPGRARGSLAYRAFSGLTE